MLGQHVAYDRVPYFFTDQYDLGMEYSGYVEPGGYDEVAFRGDAARREFTAFWLAGGRVLAGMNVNIWDASDAIWALVRSGKPVKAGMLTDPQVPLEELPADTMAQQLCRQPAQAVWGFALDCGHLALDPPRDSTLWHDFGASPADVR